LTRLQLERDAPAELGQATEAVARALAILYPLLSGSLRQRRDVVVPGMHERQPTPVVPHVPPAPVVAGTRRITPDYAGRERRGGWAARVPVETDIGLLSDSHFYTGVSQDLSSGGVFVATYHPRPPGTLVTVCFVLPDGHAVEAGGVVRWVRNATDDAPPGMGVAFQQLADGDLRAIEHFCAEREPVNYPDDDRA
jgi:uncharacterized protein (TIGR02266 family)